MRADVNFVAGVTAMVTASVFHDFATAILVVSMTSLAMIIFWLILAGTNFRCCPRN